MRLIAFLLLSFNWALLQLPSENQAENKDAPANAENRSSNKKAKGTTPSETDTHRATRDNDSTQQAKTNQTSSDNGIPSAENKSPIAQSTTDIWMKLYVILTGVIALFSVVAAWASILQAQATRQKERAWIIAKMEDVPATLIGPTLDKVPISSKTLTSNVYRLACKVENKGSSPAWLIESGNRLDVVKACNDWIAELPDTPKYGSVTNLGKFGAAMPPNALLPAFFYLTPEEAELVEQGTSALYVYGFVKYRDAFGKKHETRYCFRLKVALGLADPASRGFYIAGPPKYSRAT